MREFMNVFLVVLLSVLAFTACQTTETEIDAETKQEEKEEKNLNKKIDVSEKFEFEQFDIEFKKVKAYEKDDKLLLDLDFSWRNKRLPNGSTLYVATLFEAIQDGEELEEINDHWNPEGDRGLQNDVFASNAAGGLSPVKLTYELKDKENDVELIFTPTTETEESQTIIIELE